MGKSDWEYFNCSQEHELDYVSNLYTEPVKVKRYLIQKCNDGTINNWTHAKVYELLREAGFTKK